MDADPASSVRTMKDSSLVRAAEAVRDGKASAMVSRRQHRRHHGVGAAAHGPHQGRGPPGHRHADPGPGRRRRPCCSTPAPTPSARPSGSCSSPRWARSSPASATASTTPRVGLLSIGEEAEQGQPAGQGDPRAAAPTAALGGGAEFIGNVEGRDIMTDDVDVVVTDGFTGNVALKTLEGGMKALVERPVRRVRVERRGQGGRRRAAAGAAAALRAARPRQHTAGRCCSASTASASSATARRRRPAIVNAVRVAAEMVDADVVGQLRRPPSADDARPRRSQAHKRGARYTPADHSRPGASVPAETHVEQGPLDRNAVFELIRDRLADILEIEPSAINEGDSLRRRPRRRLAGPDRAGRGPRRGARRAHASASASTTRTSRT